MNNKNTAANLLHSKKFVLKKIDTPSGMTEMPEGVRPGVIGLPESPVVTPEERLAIKAHEYAHVALFERDIVPQSFVQEFMGKGASNRLMNACLDAAVNAFAGVHIADLPFQYLKMPAKKFADAISKETLEEKVCTLIQIKSVLNGAYYSDHKRKLTGKYHTKRLEKLDAFYKIVSSSIGDTGFDFRVQYTACDVVNACTDGMYHSSSGFSYSRFKRACEKLLELLSAVQETEESAEEFKEKVERNAGFKIDTREVSWGRLSVQECKLDNDMPRTWKQKYNPKYCGSLRYMHRCITDMKVWGLKDRSIPPLAVLIDCSGSMEIDSSMIASILERQPASVIAGYSGNESIGSVYIIGKDGKYAKESEIENMRSECGYGNIVDGPALLWLHQQKGRKIWICDGYVTSAMEKRTKEAAEYCREFVKSAGIEYYRSVEDFFENNPSEFVNLY